MFLKWLLFRYLDGSRDVGWKAFRTERGAMVFTMVGREGRIAVRKSFLNAWRQGRIYFLERRFEGSGLEGHLSELGLTNQVALKRTTISDPHFVAAADDRSRSMPADVKLTSVLGSSVSSTSSSAVRRSLVT